MLKAPLFPYAIEKSGIRLSTLDSSSAAKVLLIVDQAARLDMTVRDQRAAVTFFAVRQDVRTDLCRSGR